MNEAGRGSVFRAYLLVDVFLVCMCTPFGRDLIGEGCYPGSFRRMAWFSRVDGVTPPSYCLEIIKGSNDIDFSFINFLKLVKYNSYL